MTFAASPVTYGFLASGGNVSGSPCPFAWWQLAQFSPKSALPFAAAYATELGWPGGAIATAVRIAAAPKKRTKRFKVVSLRERVKVAAVQGESRRIRHPAESRS